MDRCRGGNGENPDLDYERNVGHMRRETRGQDYKRFSLSRVCVFLCIGLRTEGMRHPDDEARSSTNIAQPGREEDEISQRELDRGAV